MTSSFLRTSVRLLAVLAFFGVTLITNQTPATAQQCSSTIGCPAVPYCNNTVPRTTYQVRFQLCCGTTATISAPYVITPINAPCPPFLASRTYVPPAGCRVVGIASIIPLPPLGYTFNLAACTFIIN